MGNDEEKREKRLHKELFISLVYSISATGMAQLGKTVNPVTGKVERDLKQAQNSIEMLAMLKAKTSGNLEREEQTALETALTNLRLTYVEEVKRERQEGQEQKGEKKREDVTEAEKAKQEKDASTKG